jgi:hypothetical protein
VTLIPGSLSQSTPNNSSPSSGLSNHVVGNFAAVAAANTQPNSTSSKNTCKYERHFTVMNTYIAHKCMNGCSSCINVNIGVSKWVVVERIKNIYDKCENFVIIGGKESEWFQTLEGLDRGMFYPLCCWAW